jgi:hypothetical protein
MSQPRLGANEHRSEPAENSTSPAWNALRRPNRSAGDPDNISRQAMTSV